MHKSPISWSSLNVHKSKIGKHRILFDFKVYASRSAEENPSPSLGLHPREK
ncbi:hypothetical protein CIPAW_07G044500 [Carya illinoinensis]|uniref:Uncharacterized protein n=1 Tax=Carya illinoinensis TaxID=32201 RepID=A0A8T1PZD9_CARIL|nr:hypothetical protein CIPAW_07G044500 [Carya illinoinensis]